MLTIALVLALAAQGTGGPSDPPQKTELSTAAVDVPLTKTGEFYFAEVLVNDEPLRFTLETGANFVAIGARAAQAIGLQFAAADSIAHIATLKLGGATFSGLTIRVTQRFDAQGFDGIISLPLLRDLLVTLDLTGKRMRLERGQLPPTNGRDVLGMSGRDPGGRVDMPVDVGGISLPAVIDTRSFIWILLPDSVGPRLRLARQPRAIGTAGGPSLGAFQLHGARLNGDISIGEFTIRQPALVFRDRPGVVLGVPLLEQFVITIDQRQRRIRLARSAPPDTPVVIPPVAWENSPGPMQPSSGQRTMGFNVAGPPGGALFVRNVVPGSDAEKMGLRNGDQLLEFDGTPAAAMNPTIFRAAAARRTRVRIVILRGDERLEFMIEPYVVP